MRSTAPNDPTTTSAAAETPPAPPKALPHEPPPHRARPRDPRRVELLDAGGQPVALRTCETPLDIDESLGRLSQQQRGARAALRVVLPVDPVAYRRDGYRLDGAEAEVAYITARQGVAVQTYQRREVVVVGRLREPQYGDPDHAPTAEDLIGFLEWHRQMPPVGSG